MAILSERERGWIYQLTIAYHGHTDIPASLMCVCVCVRACTTLISLPYNYTPQERIKKLKDTFPSSRIDFLKLMHCEICGWGKFSLNKLQLWNSFFFPPTNWTAEACVTLRRTTHTHSNPHTHLSQGCLDCHLWCHLVEVWTSWQDTLRGLQTLVLI